METNAERDVAFQAREFRGSRFRCLLATCLPKAKFVDWLNSLIQPHAKVTEHDVYMPFGFSRPDEARLGETRGFLSEKQRECVTSWWLAVREKANTPNWDLLSTCMIEGREGLVLLEAKAHGGELKEHDCCGAKNEQNRKQICQAIEEASKALGSDWALKENGRYQLSNRFAWAWKIASLGKPVVLVYLGFLNANEMPEPFQDDASWENCLRKYANGCVPQNAWNSDKIVVGTRLIPLIRSANVNVIAS